VSSAQQQQVQQQLEQWLLPQAVRNISAVCGTEQFMSGWTEDDVRVLLGARTAGCSSSRAQHEEASRAQYWPSLLDCLDFGTMSAADMAAVTKEYPGNAALTGRMFAALLARQIDAEEAVQGGRDARVGGRAGGSVRYSRIGSFGGWREGRQGRDGLDKVGGARGR
jgi:hypothetical protein